MAEIKKLRAASEKEFQTFVAISNATAAANATLEQAMMRHTATLATLNGQSRNFWMNVLKLHALEDPAPGMMYSMRVYNDVPYIVQVPQPGCDHRHE